MTNPMEGFRQEKGYETAKALTFVLDRYKDKRVLVVGIPGSGKSTLLRHIPQGVDMDTVLSPKLSQGERKFVFQKDVAGLTLSGDVLQTLAEMHLDIQPGHPQFATVVIPSDVIVYLKIDDELLRERLLSREVEDDRPQQYDYVKRIEEILEESIQKAQTEGVTVEEFEMRKGLNDK